jgi:predicted PurR-regulated permease PerM
MSQTKQYEKIIPFILFVLVLILFFKLIQPMIVVLLGSILLAYITYPLYKRIKKKISSKFISIVLALIVIVIIILVPFVFLTFEITKQGYLFYNSLTENVAKGAIFGFSCESTESQLCSIVNQIEVISITRLSEFGIEKQLQKFLPIIEEKITLIILTIPLMIAKMFIALIITYFILKDWESTLKRTTDLLPMRKKTITKLVEDFKKIAHTVIYAQLFVAMVQGIIATIGFYIFGVPFPLLLGVLVALFALIPMIGTAIVWVPASAFLMLTGYFAQDYATLGKGIGLFFYCLLIVSVIDNILLAKLVHKTAKISQIIVIVGVVGGVVMFGFIGIFIGPILLPLTITYFETFKEKYSHKNST